MKPGVDSGENLKGGLCEGNSMVEYQLPKLDTRVRFPSLAFKLSLWAFCMILMTGCVTISEEPKGAVLPKKGIYHKVQKGETLWRIAKTYHVSIDEIIRSNNIPNVAYVEENQLIFIPGQDRLKEVDIKEEDPYWEEFIWPTAGKIFFYFADGKGTYLNRGVGIQGEEDQIVRAAREGKVIFADYLSGYSYTVILDHWDGFHSIYSLNSNLLVKLGDHIQKGEPIAKMGKKGRLPCLYFEIRRNSIADNPLYYLPKL